MTIQEIIKLTDGSIAIVVLVMALYRLDARLSELLKMIQVCLEHMKEDNRRRSD